MQIPVMKETEDPISRIPQRLQLLRKMIAGESQTAFAAKLGIDVKRWNNFERGSPLSKEVAILIVRTFPDITLDWLFLGRTDGLTQKRQRELDDISSRERSVARPLRGAN